MWRPPVPLVREVLHARFETHAYPAHTHAEWTVLLVDHGAVTYALGRESHLAAPASVTLLPPGVPHDGRSAVRGRAFLKRVLYVEEGWLPAWAVGAAAALPTAAEEAALAAAAEFHASVLDPREALSAEGALLHLRQSLLGHLGQAPSQVSDAPLARRLRELLEDRLTETFTLVEAGRVLGAHPSHLVRVFSRAYGIPPHRYVVGRRVDLARRMLLGGHTPTEAAALAGFHDQAHLTRHFRRTLGTTPGTFTGATRPSPGPDRLDPDWLAVGRAGGCRREDVQAGRAALR